MRKAVSAVIILCGFVMASAPAFGHYSWIDATGGRIVSESGTVQFTAGEHDYGFDISDEPSGIYFVQIDTGSIILSESVIRIP
ncbi:MAG: T9SS type A sorting domain-containing protein [Candidatus Aegiribacteria sp.]|nr:T9SS type A sorting domain-containing protein [Candidatus Aegiribacteria sp.]